MAAHSPWRLQLQWEKSALPKNKSLNIRVHSIIYTHRKRCSFTSYTTSCCTSRPNNNAVSKSDKQLTIVKVSVNDEVSVTETKQLPNNKLINLNYKPLFGWPKSFIVSKKVRGIILMNLITLLYASNIPVLKKVEAIADPAAFTVVRFAIAAIPFLPSVLRSRGDVRTFNSGIELGLWASLGYLMQALALLTSDAGRASFIAMFTVIVVPLIDGMLGAVIPARTWFGALMSIIGVGMLESSGSPPCVGDFLNFLSALFFGIHMLRTEHISRKTNKEDFLAVLGYEVCVVAFSSIIWYLIGGTIDGSLEYHPSSWKWASFLKWIVNFPWIPALYTGVFTTGLCLWIEMAAMRDVSATETAIIYGLEPVWGAGFAWFLLGERWGVFGWFGAALVLGGSLMVQIVGASSPSSYVESDDSRNEEDSTTLVSNTENEIFASPVLVGSKKDVSDLLNK
ncbi:uncharacterized protein [Rutidosis leptorrhynchoides]|uniref:uncharacterized protein n=1 Tax=Rutidosis leptorrhynchoides TaxID=125765 RepID=UPI003A9919A8